MLKKLLTLSLMLLFASSLVVAQASHVLKANGELIKLKKAKDLKEALIVSKLTKLNGKVAKNVVAKGVLNPQATPDTLSYADLGIFNTNFGQFDQNVMMQYFVAPADLTIKGAGFSVSDAEAAAKADMEVRLLKLNWTFEQLTGVPAPMKLGAYPSEGDGLGGKDPFGEEATGNWIDGTDGAYPLPPFTDNADPTANTWDYDLWSDAGFGWPVAVTDPSSGEGDYYWVDMSNLFEPEVLQGEVFAVAVVNPLSENTDNAAGNRIGFFSDNTLGIPGLKYYEESRLDNTDPADGWWFRLYTWDFAVAVELTGDRAPVITGVTSLLTTVDQGNQTVEAMIVDDNPSGGDAGVQTADIHWSIDGGTTFTPAAMADQGGGMWSGEIPGQAPGTDITYKVVATDVLGNTAETGPQTYSIFAVVNTNLLVIYNGSSGFGGNFLVGPYYLLGTVENFDLWDNFGPVGDFINGYDAILEIHGEGGPASDNQVALTNFAASGDKVLGVIGQETLGFLNGYTDSVFVEGDFEYEILGVQESFNDINYNPDAGFDQTGKSLVRPIANTMYGGSMASWLDTNAFGVDSIFYDPDNILGGDNWMDQFTPREGLPGHEVFMHGFSWDGNEVPVGHNWTHPVNTDIFFMSADPLSFDTDSAWIGASSFSPLIQLIQDKIVSVEKIDNSIPSKHSLSQNYPNPFNPSTTINFAINKSGLTTLKVFNILGQEVATLVDKDLAAGSYSVDFDASELSSGMYIYTIKNGDFEISKKMMLLK